MDGLPRRKVLRCLAGGVLPLSGCLSAGTANRTLEVGESYESEGGRTVTVRGVQVRRLIRSTSVGSATHIDVAWLAGHQFAVVDAEATGADGTSVLSDVQFALEVDGVQYPRPDQHWYWAFPPGSHDRPGRPAFPAPVTDATDGAIVWRRENEPSVRWTLPSETVEQFERAPSFTVRSFDAPDSVSRGDSFDAAFTVTNTSEHDGRFVAEFGAGPISDHGEVAMPVSAEAGRTHAGIMDPHYPRNASEIQVTLDWGRKRVHRTVTVTE